MAPKEGVVVENYNYFGQGTDFNECGISIAKPLASEDIGFWKMVIITITNNEYRPYKKDGGFLYVGNTSHSGQLQNDV